jgi:hypothetical protein
LYGLSESQVNPQFAEGWEKCAAMKGEKCHRERKTTPLFAIASAIDLPIPREEPVIRATLPV